MKAIQVWEGDVHDAYCRVVVSNSAADTPLPEVEIRRTDLLGAPRWEVHRGNLYSHAVAKALLALADKAAK